MESNIDSVHESRDTQHGTLIDGIVCGGFVYTAWRQRPALLIHLSMSKACACATSGQQKGGPFAQLLPRATARSRPCDTLIQQGGQHLK